MVDFILVVEEIRVRRSIRIERKGWNWDFGSYYEVEEDICRNDGENGRIGLMGNWRK